MKETIDLNAEYYMDGTIIGEIEHLLIMRLHSKNTIEEIEILKGKIHEMMMHTYNEGQSREDE